MRTIQSSSRLVMPRMDYVRVYLIQAARYYQEIREYPPDERGQRIPRIHALLVTLYILRSQLLSALICPIHQRMISLEDRKKQFDMARRRDQWS